MPIQMNKKFVLLLLIPAAVILAVWGGLYIYKRIAITYREYPTLPKTLSQNGVQVEVFNEGGGEPSKEGNILMVYYSGYLPDGSMFASNYHRPMPFIFKLGSGAMVKGWDLGIEGMKAGETRRITIPPELAGGLVGYPSVPPGSSLIFKVELLGIFENEDQLPFKP